MKANDTDPFKSGLVRQFERIMVWATFTIEQLDVVSRQLFMPLVLVITYTLLLYLLLFYWSRRQEIRVRVLFASGSLGLAVLIPFAIPNDSLVYRLNDVSESCSVLTFLLQITIIGRDLNKQMRFRTVLWLTYVAELLILVDMVLVLLTLVDIFKDDLFSAYVKYLLPTINQTVTLVYVFVFRYYYIVTLNGWRDVVRNRKLETMWYLLFATHMLPWYVLTKMSGLPWDPVQALWHRITLAGSLWTTAHAKLRVSSKAQSTISTVPTSRYDSNCRSFNIPKSSPKRNVEPVQAEVVTLLTYNSQIDELHE